MSTTCFSLGFPPPSIPSPSCLCFEVFWALNRGAWGPYREILERVAYMPRFFKTIGSEAESTFTTSFLLEPEGTNFMLLRDLQFAYPEEKIIEVFVDLDALFFFTCRGTELRASKITLGRIFDPKIEEMFNQLT
jgi:hypothetical protein